MSQSKSFTDQNDPNDPNYVDWENMQNIRVICRFRPIVPREIREEKNAGLTDIPPIISNNGQCVKVHRESCRFATSPLQFNLDKILPTTTSQDSLYTIVGKPMVEACLEGYNSTIFAYGQTGSGKTFSMFGPENAKTEEIGCVQRSLSYLFAQLNQRKQKKSVTEWKVVLHFVQLYREQLTDLLEPDHKGLPLKIRFDPYTNSPYVPNLKKFDVTEMGEVSKLLAVANTNRVTDTTLMNTESSRSHMIMTLKIEQRLYNGTVKKSKLHFADLAGSESYEKAWRGSSNCNRDKVAEMATINLSLTNLTTCINYLSKGRKASHRSSKLTFYLMDSLGGNSKTTLVVTASPHIYNRNETIRALRFAKTAKSVKNKAKVNKELSKAQLMALVKKLQKENKHLKARLAMFEAELPVESVNNHKKKTNIHRRARSLNVLDSAELTKTRGELLCTNTAIQSTNVAGNVVDECAYNKLKAQLKSFEAELSLQEEETNVLRQQLAKTKVELDGVNEELQTSRNMSHKLSGSGLVLMKNPEPSIVKTKEQKVCAGECICNSVSFASLSSQLDALQKSEKQLVAELQCKNEELDELRDFFKAQREEYQAEKFQLEEELQYTKSDVRQYESIMNNMFAAVLQLPFLLQ